MENVDEASNAYSGLLLLFAVVADVLRIFYVILEALELLMFTTASFQCVNWILLGIIIEQYSNKFQISVKKKGWAVSWKNYTEYSSVQKFFSTLGIFS